MDEKTLDEIEHGGNWWLEQRQRARERLKNYTADSWHFAMLGIHTDVEHFRFHNSVRFQTVTEPPGEISLAGAIKNKALFGAVGRYSHNIRYELAIDRNFGSDQSVAFTLA